MRDRIMHILNPLHVYCRMRKMHIPAGAARRTSLIWEWIYQRILWRT